MIRYLASPDGSLEQRKYRLKLISAWGHSGAELVLQKSPPVIRMVLTVCSSLRSFRLPVKVDLTPITSPGVNLEGVIRPGEVKAFWSELRRVVRVPKLESVRFGEWHFTLKSGPGKGQALLNWFNDLVSLPEGLVADLSLLGGKVMEESLRVLLENLPAIKRVYQPKVGPIRRLVGISDLEGKTRVIAILDYFSQNALRPVHDFLFRILRQIPQDVTFSQGSFKDKVDSWGEGCTLYSLDLTAATDRFPIAVITAVLEGFFPREFVAAWQRVMVDHPFKVEGQDTTISYSVGNPMGAYSS